MTAMETFDLTPDPKVLIALTHTPMLPLDALCELIDNAIDSFHTAELQGEPIEHPLVAIELPTQSELRKGVGMVRVRDNGPGLSQEVAEKAIRAGYSSHNPYDTLGLFGLGFNISTGKIGRVTSFFTARPQDASGIHVKIDLDEIRRSGSYEVPFRREQKDSGFQSGTVVAVQGWWPEGNANSGFIRKLVQYGMPTIRREIGRRYATILRERKIRILLNEEPCEPFEHCVWDDSRFVERRSYGRIPAVIRFNELVGSQKRCANCIALIPPNSDTCPACGSSSLRTIEERIRGWLGIQRFDHPTNFGVDLIRRGRAIRVAEKAAFFEYEDEFKRVTKDYPIDNPYGRIVGEVHLDHVPVDFLKQDFQRSSPEWQRAITFLRGDSSLQPRNPGAQANKSPMFLLYQGYRRVRTPGRTDMYMGYWDTESGQPKRISRDIEREYYEKFKQRLPGFYDDTEWWKLVEQADQKPLEELVECPECSAQNLRGHDMCQVCGHVLVGKQCVNPECGETIAQTAQTCPHCGCTQAIEIKEPWTCAVCRERNLPDAISCSGCGNPRGTADPVSREALIERSHKDDDLSIPGCSVPLADGTHSQPIDVDVYVTSEPIRPYGQGEGIPLIAFKGERIEVFVNPSHQCFRLCRIRVEQMVAAEVALYIYDVNRRLAGPEHRGRHTLSTLTWSILRTRWGSLLAESPERLRAEVNSFWDSLREKLPTILQDVAQDYFRDMPEEHKRSLVENIMSQGQDVGCLGDLRDSGEYLGFLSEDAIVDVFKKYAPLFFDGRFWSDSYSEVQGIDESLLAQARQRVKATYLNCLEDLASFLRLRSPESLVLQRARASLDIVSRRVVA